MRTTINLPDALAEAAKAKAASERRTFTSVVEEGLRTVLTSSGDSPRTPVRLPTSGKPGDRLLIELEDREALWSVLDADGVR